MHKKNTICASFWPANKANKYKQNAKKKRFTFSAGDKNVIQKFQANCLYQCINLVEILALAHKIIQEW